MNKANGATDTNESLESEIGKSIPKLKRAGPAVSHTPNAKKQVDDLGLLFRRMTERSTCEVDNLIDELHSLRKKLETDEDLIERAIARHSQFSQGAMQLTTLIADNVKKLPHPAS